ncbi:unnamed protein product [Haemonchus placei]|uniref:Transcription-associated protein 1 n=1 Tax=Haemonchus placei TaxID=6290 RepID=A0A158QKY7_HAEPC|nr:unnamed protein product [Haemonchus placei]
MKERALGVHTVSIFFLEEGNFSKYFIQYKSRVTMTSQMVRGNVPMQQMAPQPILPGDQDALIRTLNDVNQRDDVKLKAVQDAWSKFDAFSVTPTFDQFLDSLMRAFLKLFSETVPQFIVENNTQMLRKAMLEMILRTSAHEPVKNLSKEIQKQMMRIIVLENEENAILAIKIVVDHSKIARSHLIPEVSVMLQNFKQWVKCMCVTLSRSHTFDTIDLTHPSVQLPEEAMIETYLQQCYYTQSALLYSPNGTLDTLYNLIPRASQSLKAFQDIPMLAMEFLLCCLDFLSIQISNEQKADEKYNKALADEFYTAQSKMLAYLSIMGKIREFMDQILANGDRFVNGVLALLEQCPAELIVVRKDVLITLKFFFISDLRPKFIQLLPRLLSELALIGSGYTAVDHLSVAFIFCREMHDNLLPYQVASKFLKCPPYIQVICARMLSSVLEGLTKHAKEGEAVSPICKLAVIPQFSPYIDGERNIQNRDLILMILESLVVKMKVLAVYHMPLLFKQHGAEINYDYKSCDRDGSDNADEDKGSDDVIREEVRRCSIDTAPEMEIGPADPLQPPSPSLPVPKENGTHKQSSPGSILTQMYAMNAPPIPLVEARTIVKFILLACKMGTSALSGANRSAQSPPLVRERDIFERMFKYCVQCLDVFMIPFPQPPSRVQVPNSVPGGTRSKEEKDALDALAYLFTMLNLDVFGEIFTKYMDFFVVRMAKNLPLQLACNAFLVRADVSFRFGCIIVKYLMDRLPCLAVMNDVSTLYVKLFKIIFSAIGCQNSASPDGEIMLKPYLPELIRKSMEYALSARDPINYFMLLRALFRSIGGGLHDILYSQFLPLLPDLMLFFNKLQWCDHRQMMRELFVELCLTVPVRLSTLLPHLPLLMEPLVCALNGGPNLVQQGLYKIVGKSVEPQSVATAVRVLGKFGGANRNMFTEPPSLKSHPKGDQPPFTIRVAFDRPNTSQTFFSTIYGDLALTEIVRTALKQIRLDPSHQHYSTQVRLYAMELARSVLLSSFAPLDFSEKWEVGLKDRFVEQFKRLENAPDSCTVLRCAREGDRSIHSDALMILFCKNYHLSGIVGKDLRSKYIKFFNASIRYLTLQALLEFTGRAALMSLDHPAQCMDGGILVDAIVTALSDSTKDFCQSAIVGLRHINDVCRAVIPNLEVMPRIPFVRYLIESVSALCYASSWFVRLGGASGLMYFIENYPESVVLTNMNGFMESLVEVLVGMTDQVSCGAVDMAVGAIEKLQKRCLTGCHVNDPKVSLFMNCVANHLFSGNQHVRQKTLAMLNTCAEVLTISLSTLLFNYREVFLAQIDRAMNEFNVLALLDRCGCLEALCTIFKCQPPLVDISIESERIQNFAKELIRALVTLYKALILQAENATSQKMDTSTSTIDVQVRSETLEKIACVAIETVLCPLPSVVKAAEEALMQNYICGHVTRYPLGSSPTSTPPLDGQDVEAITQTVRLLLLVDDPSGAKLATDIAAFIAYFDHHYCTSAYDAWIPPLATLLSRYARESMAFFLSEESLSMPCRRALLRKLIKDEECAPIRSLLMQDSSYFVNLLENRVMDASGEWREPSPAQQNESGIMEREMLCLHIIDAVSRRNVQWFADAKDLIIKLRQLWNNADFKGRYVVHAPCSKDLQELTIKMMTEHKHNNNDLDLLCDILFVFIGRYVTDFCFVREFLEREVIPTYSMEWRRKLFSYVLGKFEAGGSTVIKDLLYVKIVQYVLIPSLQWAFERYNVDEILGEIQNPSEQPENDPNDLVYRLAHIIDQNRQVMSDGIVIVLYQLCTLLVKHAPRHVFQALCGSFQYDSRELVRRAADVVTAAMPIRMDDGHHQMFINVKRVLCEEAHSLQHIQHIVSMVVRNYRSYFSCRHALFKPLMNAVRRVISTPNSAMDGVMTRKLALDMCEMVIKWELLRLQKVEQLTQGLTSHDDEFESLLNDQDRQAGPSSSNIPTSNAGGDFDDQLYKQMSKECADEVVAMLLKFAIQPTTGVQPHQLHQATVENGKRSIGLMKQCLKSAVWGDIVTIKVGWLEKELTVPPESLVRQENQAQFAQSISQSQQALEVVINLVTIMLVRLVNMLVSKLFEKSNCSMTGMYEFEILNQFISKYLNDHFNSYVKSSACMIMNAFTALSLLRVICTQQPGYLDAMCLQAYIKVLEKAVREHIGHITEQGEATREKVATAEMIAMALEMLRPRVEAISAEAKRTICQNVLLPLIERSTFDKIIDVVLRVVSELVVTHRDENCANPGLPLLVRLQSVVEKRYRANSELMKMFLKVVLFVFEHPLLLTSDYAEKLEDAFHWGLTAQDREMREKFLLVFERNLAVNPIARTFKERHRVSSIELLEFAIVKCFQCLLLLDIVEYSLTVRLLFGEPCTR